MLVLWFCRCIVIFFVIDNLTFLFGSTLHLYIKAKLAQYGLMSKGPEHLKDGARVLGLEVWWSVTLCSERGEARSQMSQMSLAKMSSMGSWWNISPCVDGCLRRPGSSSGGKMLGRPSWRHNPQADFYRDCGQNATEISDQLSTYGSIQAP